MCSLFLTNTFSNGPKQFTEMLRLYNQEQLLVMKTRRKKTSTVVCCQGSSNSNANSDRFSSFLTQEALKKSTTTSSTHLHSVPPKGAAGRVNNGIGIVSFFTDKNILITGATGLFAKVLLEKILRTVPDVGTIYLLIKARNKEAANERLMHEIINAELFKCLQQTHGKSYQSFMLSKLVAVVGNVSESNLALETDIADLVAKQVDIIVHSAAYTTFDGRYDVALDINTKGVGHLISFAKRCKKLKLFLHLSTAYVNGKRKGRVMEKPFIMGDSIARENIGHETPHPLSSILDLNAEIQLVLDFKATSEDHSVAQNMKKLGLERANKYGWQDTYVFTKAMGEMLIEKMRGEIPVVVIRPSVIESSYKEPFPGWIEGNRMLEPLILNYGKGRMSGFVSDPNTVIDVVPIDMVANACIAAMAKHGAAGKPGFSVYHVASSVANPLTFGGLFRSFYEHFNSIPCLDSQGNPIHVEQFKFFSSMEDFSSQLLKDAIKCYSTASAMNNTNKSKLEIICRKSVEHLKHFADVYKAYTLYYAARFDNSNTQKLMDCMSKEEMEEFGFDVRCIDWKDYIEKVHIPGVRKHVLKERMKDF